MHSLVGYESDEDSTPERVGLRSVVGLYRRREDEVKNETVNMGLSEETHSGESDSERRSGWSGSRRTSREYRRVSFDGRDKERNRSYHRNRTSFDLRDRVRLRSRAGAGPRDRERFGPGPRDRERDGPGPRDRERDGREPYDRRDGHRDRRLPRRDDRNKDRYHGIHDRRRPSLSDRHDDKDKVPPSRGRDTRDAVSPRFTERGRRYRERERARDRGKESRYSRRREERKSTRSDRSRSRGRASKDRERRGSPRERSSGEYRPSSYKVNRKLQVMEKMGLQIKTPDGTMTTAQELRAAANDSTGELPPFYTNATSSKAVDEKRKLLWSYKEKSDSPTACWSGAKFSQDNDGKQVSKFMRLMGIKDGGSSASSNPEEVEVADPNKKQEELFQAMQAQYEVARTATHTMRGVGLGFQRGNF